MKARFRFILAASVLGLLMTGPFALIGREGRGTCGVRSVPPAATAGRRRDHPVGPGRRCAAVARPVPAVRTGFVAHGRDPAPDAGRQSQLSRRARRPFRSARAGACGKRPGAAARRVAERCRSTDQNRQGDGGRGKEPAGRADVRAGAGRRGVQSRWPHPSLQQPGAVAVQGLGAGADVDERWRADRAWAVDFFHSGARPDHPFAGEYPAAVAPGQRRADGQLHYLDAWRAVVALSDGTGAPHRCHSGKK